MAMKARKAHIHLLIHFVLPCSYGEGSQGAFIWTKHTTTYLSGSAWCRCNGIMAMVDECSLQEWKSMGKPGYFKLCFFKKKPGGH